MAIVPYRSPIVVSQSKRCSLKTRIGSSPPTDAIDPPGFQRPVDFAATDRPAIAFQGELTERPQQFGSSQEGQHRSQDGEPASELFTSQRDRLLIRCTTVTDSGHRAGHLSFQIPSVIVTRANLATIASAVGYGLDRWQLQLLTTGTG